MRGPIFYKLSKYIGHPIRFGNLADRHFLMFMKTGFCKILQVECFSIQVSASTKKTALVPNKVYKKVCYQQTRPHPSNHWIPMSECYLAPDVNVTKVYLTGYQETCSAKHTCSRTKVDKDAEMTQVVTIILQPGTQAV